jgi:hypothetical protein
MISGLLRLHQDQLYCIVYWRGLQGSRKVSKDAKNNTYAITRCRRVMASGLPLPTIHAFLHSALRLQWHLAVSCDILRILQCTSPFAWRTHPASLDVWHAQSPDTSRCMPVCRKVVIARVHISMAMGTRGLEKARGGVEKAPWLRMLLWSRGVRACTASAHEFGE